MRALQHRTVRIVYKAFLIILAWSFRLKKLCMGLQVLLLLDQEVALLEPVLALMLQ